MELAEKSYDDLAIKRDRAIKELTLKGPLFAAFQFDMINRSEKAKFLLQTGQLKEEDVNKFLTQVAPDPWSDSDEQTRLTSFPLYVGDVKVKQEIYDAAESLLQKSASEILHEKGTGLRVIDLNYPLSMKFFLLTTTDAYLVLRDVEKQNATLTDLELRLFRYLGTVAYSESVTLANVEFHPIPRREAVLRTFQIIEELRFETPFNFIVGESVVAPNDDVGNVVGMAVPLSEAAVEREREKNPDEVLVKSPSWILQENLHPSLFRGLILLLNEGYVLRYDNPQVKVIYLFTQSDFGSVLPAAAPVLTVTLFADILNILPPGYDEQADRKILGQAAFQTTFLGMEEPLVWKGRVWRQPEMIAPWYRVPSSIGATKDPELNSENLITLVFSREITFSPTMPTHTIPFPTLLSFDVRNHSAGRVGHPLVEHQDFSGKSLLEGFKRASIIMTMPFKIEGKFVLQRPGLPTSIQEVVLRTIRMETKFLALWSDDVRIQPVFLPSKLGWNRFWLTNILYYPLHELMTYNESIGRYIFRTAEESASARPWANGNIEMEISPRYAAKVMSEMVKRIGMTARTWMETVVELTQEATTLSEGEELDDAIDRIITHRQGIREAKRVVQNTAAQHSHSRGSVLSPTLLKEIFSRAITAQLRESYRQAKAALPLATQRFNKLNNLITKAKQRIPEIQRELTQFSPLQDTSTRVALKKELQDAHAFLNLHNDVLEDIHSEFENNMFEYAKFKRIKDFEIVKNYWKTIDDGSRSRFFSVELEELRGGIGAYHGDFVAVPQQSDWENGILTLVPAEGSVLPLDKVTLVSMQLFMSGRDLASLMHKDLEYKFLLAKQTLEDPTISPEVKQTVEKSIFVVNTLAQGTGLAFESLQHARTEAVES